MILQKILVLVSSLAMTSTLALADDYGSSSKPTRHGKVLIISVKSTAQKPCNGTDANCKNKDSEKRNGSFAKDSHGGANGAEHAAVGSAGADSAAGGSTSSGFGSSVLSLVKSSIANNPLAIVPTSLLVATGLVAGAYAIAGSAAASMAAVSLAGGAAIILGAPVLTVVQGIVLIGSIISSADRMNGERPMGVVGTIKAMSGIISYAATTSKSLFSWFTKGQRVSEPTVDPSELVDIGLGDILPEIPTRKVIVH